MQTFLPYPSYTKSASCLDNKRLGKQRVETMQIYKSLTIPTYGWKNHPAVKMWKGYERSLLHYGKVICSEWIFRGFNDSLWHQFNGLLIIDNPPQTGCPSWLTEEFCKSHRSNLLRKDPMYYMSKFEDGLPNNLSYIWPVK